MERTPGSPLELQPAGAPVVRLNRRVLYVLGAALVAVFVVGLVALRAQGPPAAGDSGPVPLPGAPAGERWFDKVPDQEPIPAAAPSQLPGSPGSTPAGIEAQHQERALRAALSAPIGLSAFHTRAARPAGEPVAALPKPAATGAVIPAAAVAAQGATRQVPAAGDGKAKASRVHRGPRPSRRSR